MANEYDEPFGVGAAGWTVYVVTLAPNGTDVWNGSAFAPDSNANRNLGGLLLTESPVASGTFRGSLQGGITTPGTYFVIYYRRLTGSNDVANDTQMTYYPQSTISVYGSTATQATNLHEPSEIFRQMLIDLGLGTEGSAGSDWPAYATAEPNDPDNCVTIYDTQGMDDGRTMTDGEAWIHPGIQVRVRSKNQSVGFSKANSIRAAFCQVNSRQVSCDTSLYNVECVTHIGQILNVGQDVSPSKRRVHTLNVTTVITKLI